MSVKIIDNTAAVKAAKDAAVAKALEMIGLKAEGYAKRLAPVDTGLLRNSITHAVSGQSTSISRYQASMGSNKHKNKKGETVRYSARSKNAGSVGIGRYDSGVVGSSDEEAVYIATNVGYAPYVELGTQKTNAQPFMKPAVENHIGEYKQIVENELKNA